jgi:hypothetical protein
MQRLQDQYFAALKRAEVQYFDGVKRITDAIASDMAEEVSADVPAQETPLQEPPQQAAAS